MSGIEARIGITTAGTGGQTAGFGRGKAVLATLALALALAMIAALALSEKASAHGTGSYGFYGSHDHGQLYCGSGRITVTGMWAAANNYLNGRYNKFDDVRYRAHLYRWNGSSWAYVTTSGWHLQGFISTYGSYLNRPYPAFDVFSRGYYRVTTEMAWYDAEWWGGGNRLLGISGVNWAQGVCAY